MTVVWGTAQGALGDRDGAYALIRALRTPYAIMGGQKKRPTPHLGQTRSLFVLLVARTPAGVRCLFLLLKMPFW